MPVNVTLDFFSQLTLVASASEQHSTFTARRATTRPIASDSATSLSDTRALMGNVTSRGSYLNKALKMH